MSHLIDSLQVPEPPVYEDLKLKFRKLFQNVNYSCKNIQDNGRQITFFLKGTTQTYRLPSVWNCKIGDQVLSIQISLYNKDQDDFIRASTTMMKVQLANIVRIANNYLQMMRRAFTRFIVDNQSGALKLYYSIPLVFFRYGVTTEQIKIEITDLFMCLNHYNDIVTFIEPTEQINSLKQNIKSQYPESKIQRFQKILKFTACQKEVVSSSLKRILQMKHSSRPVHFDIINVTRQIYENNVKAFQATYIGLEDVSNYKIEDQIKNYIIDEKEYEKQFMERKRNQKGKTTSIDENIDRIVYGLVQIKAKKQLTEKEKQAEQQGGHSCIFTNQFEYYVADTIYSGTINYAKDVIVDPTIYAKKKQGQLTYKICNKGDIVAKNSFLNELAFLKHVRDMASPFIARYYLMAKEGWDQEDIVYMSTYEKNVWRLMNTRNLLMKSKLQLCYKMAKGLCFLFSKRILHRDFKHLNVVVDKLLVPKLIDFGSCISHAHQNGKQYSFKPHSCQLATSKLFQIRYHEYLVKQDKITYFNLPAKKISQIQFNQHPLFDIYSFGKTLCYIFFKAYDPPLPQKLNKDEYSKINEYLLFLVDRCLDHDPQNRPSIGQITAYIGALYEICLTKLKSIQTENSSSQTEKKTSTERSVEGEKGQVENEKQKIRGKDKQRERKRVKAKG